MSELKYDLVAIGNALVDVLAHTTEDFITEQNEKHGMVKGGMTLIDEERAVELYNSMGQLTQISGGSAANTMAGFASFGGYGGYIGKTGMDDLGKVFAHDMQAQKIDYNTVPLVTGAETGRCLILITPDAERTMNTYLGASVELGAQDLDESMISSAKIVYLEGYLFDKPPAKKAYYEGAKIAHEAGRQVALTLSDSFCVQRHKEDFRELIENHTDILFSNEDEILALCDVLDFKQAVKQIKGKCDIACITRGERGSIIVRGDEIIEVTAEPVRKIVDTTGAGDQYAAGVLYGYTNNMSLAHCGRLGSLAASEVISHVGSRPDRSYSDFLKEV